MSAIEKTGCARSVDAVAGGGLSGSTFGLRFSATHGSGAALYCTVCAWHAAEGERWVSIKTLTYSALYHLNAGKNKESFILVYAATAKLFNARTTNKATVDPKSEDLRRNKLVGKVVLQTAVSEVQWGQVSVPGLQSMQGAVLLRCVFWILLGARSFVGQKILCRIVWVS